MSTTLGRVAGTFWQIFGAVGRIAFPIFTFQVATGFIHTHNRKRYILTMGLFALISEIPFNMAHGTMVDPFTQNVMFTFFIALLMVAIMEKLAPLPWVGTGKIIKGVLSTVIFTLIRLILGFFTFVDYFDPGVVLVIGFYFFYDCPKNLILSLCKLY